MRSRQQTIAIILSKFKKNLKHPIPNAPDRANIAGNRIANKHHITVSMGTVGYSGDWKLHHLEVIRAKRKQGLGSKAMVDIVAAADKANKRVLLDVASSQDKEMGTTSSARLHKFYKRFGFVRNRGRKSDYTISAGMYRNPVPKKAKSIIP